MTGARFKAFFVKLYGPKWAKPAGLDLQCSASSCMRYAISAKIPDHVAEKVNTLLAAKHIMKEKVG